MKINPFIPRLGILLKKPAFTLVEMLIVIVIIGILAAALIPRLTSARSRANDTARKADLQQIATAIVAYQLDAKTFPTASGAVSNISGNLISAGINAVPSDPDKNRVLTGIASNGTAAGQYGYTPVKRNGNDNQGFVVMAATETAGGSNRLYTGLSITGAWDAKDITPCRNMTSSGTASNVGGVCTYPANFTGFRYIIIY